MIHKGIADIEHALIYSFSRRTSKTCHTLHQETHITTMATPSMTVTCDRETLWMIEEGNAWTSSRSVVIGDNLDTTF